MRAMVLERIVSLDDVDEPLVRVELPVPEPAPGEVLLKVVACGVCHTELDEIPIRPEVEIYRFEEANRALVELKRGPVRGAKVLVLD